MRIVSRQPSDGQPARMAPLSILPIFLDLHGKRVVVAGGSDAAAWKAELLAAAGAQVHVFAPAGEFSDEFARLLADIAHNIVHHDEGWSDAALAGAAMAVADAENEGQAAAFAQAARRLGVPCNVIDRPEFCAFQFGSIVNRSPVVVGISSSGAAPILAQAIRRRIETLLPPALAQWAALAQRLRAAVTQRLKPGGERRVFWEVFVERAFGPPPAEHEALQLEHVAAGLSGAPSVSRGRLTVIGAGPGNADLLTLKAVRALQAADVIFFDDGISGEMLELARREAKRILLRSGSEAEAIEQMVRLAKAGKRAVHLQPGDVSSAHGYMSKLMQRGIPVEIIPGIAAGAGRLQFADLARTAMPEAGTSPALRPPRTWRRAVI